MNWQDKGWLLKSDIKKGFEIPVIFKYNTNLYFYLEYLPLNRQTV